MRKGNTQALRTIVFLCGRNQYFVSDRIGGLFVQSTLGALSESVVHEFVLLDLVNLKRKIAFAN